jgi:hypothetical protein
MARAIQPGSARLERPVCPAWFKMRIGLILGLFTAWPVNTWLTGQGWEEKV